MRTRRALGLFALWRITRKPPVPGSGDWRPGEERVLPSLCMGCPAACGILVRVVEGRAVKVAGNPRHPVSRGALCPRGQALLQRLYNPDRVRGPLRRVGRRGGGDWEPVSWDDAIARVTTALREARKRGLPEAVFRNASGHSPPAASPAPSAPPAGSAPMRDPRRRPRSPAT